VEVQVPGRKGPSTFKADEHNRPDATIEALAKLKPVFRDGGTITAGNAPGLNTAAAAMVLANEAWANERGLTPLARLVAYGIAAVEPGLFGLGPIPAVKQALARAGWSTAIGTTCLGIAWFASGDKLNAVDPASGKTLRSIDVAAHAGTTFDGQNLFQIAEDRIQKIDPKTGGVLATIPAPGRRR
jgi:hypothetical protein